MNFDRHIARAVLFVVAFACAPQLLLAEWRPLALGEVEMLLVNSVSSRRIAVLVREHGVDFTLPDGEADRLRSLGLDNSAIRAIRETYKGGKPEGGTVHVRSEESLVQGTKPEIVTVRKPSRARSPAGTLYIDTEPVGAMIFEKGKYQGRTPLEIRLGEGLHVLVFVREKYEAEAVPVVIREGVNPPISVKFIPK